MFSIQDIYVHTNFDLSNLSPVRYDKMSSITFSDTIVVCEDYKVEQEGLH